MKIAAVIAASLALGGSLTAARAAPPSVASLDFCADQYVLALAEPGQIAGVSPQADREFSFFADRASGLPVIGASAEEILIREPDVAVRIWGGGYDAAKVLERFGVSVVQVSMATTLEEARQNLLTVGEALNQSARARALADDMERRLDAVKQSLGSTRPEALYITASGATSGRDTIIHDMLTAAGLTNMSANLGTSPWYPVDIEALALSSPDLFVAGFFDLQSAQLDNWSFSRHSFLQSRIDAGPVVDVPSREVSCAAWFAIDAIERIAAGRKRLESAKDE